MSQLGQDQPIRLDDCTSAVPPIASIRTVIRRVAKGHNRTKRTAAINTENATDVFGAARRMLTWIGFSAWLVLRSCGRSHQ